MSPSPFRALALSAAACGAAVSLTGCGALTGLLGAAAGQDDVFQLEVGDCFTGTEMEASLSGEEVSEVPTVDCAEEHDSEVYHIEVLPEGDYPGAESLNTSAEEVCQTKFEEFVGISYAESEIYLSYLTPIEEGWNSFDDREIVCYLVTDGETVTGSLAGAAR
ncbi:Septum formation [Nocardiopsis flavescens]|uniref:Septum formation n=1 Tax=Nocardiopsis flavescens TaxID=758803 RepID=A0A1M6DVE3_9ACTN|nr:septum formation family protein [Nocardiopsis flavescens]SHI77099.1 Septum formation [Nocardiopsis flavescens]